MVLIKLEIVRNSNFEYIRLTNEGELTMIELQYFERFHFNQLINWIDTPEFLLQWGGPNFTFPLNEQQLEKYVEKANTDNSDILIYSILNKETRNVIGHISLGQIDRKNQSANIGKVLVGDTSVA